MPRCVDYLLVGALLTSLSCDEQEARSSDGEPTDESTTVSNSRSGRFVGGKIVTDTFEVRHHLNGETLTLVLDTDLPDNTDLMVGVYRLYKERCSNEDYMNDYYSQKSTVKAWRSPREVSLNPDIWHRELDKKQRMLAAAGLPFEVAVIADEVVISFVVPVNQENPRFGDWNKNLVGKALGDPQGDMRVVRREIVFDYPLTGDPPNNRWADPRGLQAQKTYVVDASTPLMTEYDPVDPLAAIEATVYLPPESRITVREVRDRRGEPWYRVDAVSANGQTLGSGWVNSTALIGQNIRELVG